MKTQLSPEEVIAHRAAHAESSMLQQPGGFAGLLERKLTLALTPILAELPETTRRLLFRDTLGIVYWLHTEDIDIVFHDPPVLKSAIRLLSSILTPLNELERQLGAATQIAREEFNESLSTSFLKRFIVSGLRSRTEADPHGRNWHRAAVHICVLALRCTHGARKRLWFKMGKPNPSKRLKEVRAFEELSQICSSADELIDRLAKDYQLIAMLLLDQWVYASRPVAVIHRLAKDTAGKRDGLRMAHSTILVSIQWAQNTRHDLMVMLGKHGQGAGDKQQTLDHIREAIFYLTEAWKLRTGQPPKRKNLKEETIQRHKDRGTPITAEVSNTPYERFINAALDAFHPLNKRPLRAGVQSLKPYDAQVSDILRGRYCPRSVARMDLATI